jgi:hypothetical protein
LGLGLPLSKQIVEAIGGKIWIESAGAGTGTIARLELPVSVKDASPTVIDGKLYIGSADDAFPEEISGRIYVFELP